MSEAKKKPDAVVKVESEDAEDAGPRNWKRWALGWVVLPGSVVGVIWFGGVLIGAHFHDSWFTESIVWVADLF